MHPKSRNVVNGMTFMKKTMIRKLIYALACLFLLCNFFCLSNGEQSASNAFSYDDRSSTSIVAARKGETGLAIGNVVGSNIFNLLFILGISGTISPMAVNLATITDFVILRH